MASVKDKKQAEAQALINGPVSGGGIEKVHRRASWSFLHPIMFLR